MDLLKKCALNFEKILAYQYHFVVGRKGISREFLLNFDEADFHHLVGLHKLRDITQIQQGKRSNVFKSILNDTITMDLIQKSHFYGEMSSRIEPLTLVEKMLDDNKLIFRYNEKIHKYSVIKADYLLEWKNDANSLYLFLGKRDESEIQMCRTFFPKQDKDYAQGQAQYTLLKKEKICLSNHNVEVQYDRLTFKH